MTLSMVWTDYGLSQLASAPGGSYIAPNYLAIETTYATLQNGGTLAAGATSVTLSTRVDTTGDTQLVLSVGLGTQETVPFSSVVASGPNWFYTLSSPTTKSHAFGDICLRQPTTSDTMANIISEMVVDPVNLPGQRLDGPTGYAGTVGVYTIQFYMTGTQGNGMAAIVYLTDNENIGQGNIHAYGVLGINHSFAGGGSTNDLEIDAVVTIVRA